MYFDEVLKRLEERVGSRPKRNGMGYTCLCPAHDDKNPSLSFTEGNDGKILLHCHAGCTVNAICSALGLKLSDLFIDPVVRDEFSSGKTGYIYISQTGNPLYKKVRLSGKKFYILSRSPSGTWERGMRGGERVLYRLPEVLKAKKRGEIVFVVEGEKDADKLYIKGLTATTPIEGAGTGLPAEYVAQLMGCHVVILYDEDPAGHKRRDQWKELLVGKAASVRVVKLPGLEFMGKGGPDVSDWLSAGHSVKELLELVDQAECITVVKTDGGSGLVVMDLGEFLTRDIQPREMILDPIIPTQGLAMLFSKRGVGKTFLSLSIGYAVATGTSILRWKSSKSIKVLFVDGEMPASLMQERLIKLVAGTRAALPDPSYFRLITPDLQEAGIPDISTSRGQQLLEATIGDAKLLILDNLSTLAPSLQENEADAWAPIQTWALKMRRQGVSVLFIHHAGKSGQQRGTSRREDVLDTVLELKHAEDYSGAEGANFEIHIKKARGFYGGDAEPFVASLVNTSEEGLCWSMSEVQDDLYDEVVEGIEGRKSYRKLAGELGISRSKVEGIVKKARLRGDLPKSKDGERC